ARQRPWRSLSIRHASRPDVKFRSSLLSLTFCCALALSTVTLAAPGKPANTQELASGSALLIDLQTNEVLYSSNPELVVPIASVTKLMTAMVVLDAGLPLDEVLPIVVRDTAEMTGVYSRVRVGSQISRRDMLLLTLMSSENRAAASLAHHYPGGHAAFIGAMNAKASALGMHSSEFVEPTGLSERNVSNAKDLV